MSLPENPFNSHCWITGKPAIGKGTWIGAFTLIDGLGGLTIGENCNISSGAQILSHSTMKRCLTEKRVPTEYRKTVIEDCVFVGTNATVLMGAKIGHHSVIAAGAVVLEGTEVPPYSLMVGVPAKKVKCLKDSIDGWQHTSIEENPESKTSSL